MAILIKLPLYLTVSYKTKKDKKFWLTLNNYRNWHHRVANNLKHQFCDEMREQLEGRKFSTPIKPILYYNRNLNSSDYDAIAPVVKFFLDALVYYGCIEDDNKTKVFPVEVLPIDCEKNCAYVEIEEDIDINEEIAWNNAFFREVKKDDGNM